MIDMETEKFGSVGHVWVLLVIGLIMIAVGVPLALVKLEELTGYLYICTGVICVSRHCVCSLLFALRTKAK